MLIIVTMVIIMVIIMVIPPPVFIEGKVFWKVVQENIVVGATSWRLQNFRIFTMQSIVIINNFDEY